MWKVPGSCVRLLHCVKAIWISRPQPTANTADSGSSQLFSLFFPCEVCSSVSIGNQTTKNLGNQTMYFQNHHFLVPGPHRVRATSNSRDENGFWSKEMLTIFTSSRRIRLWILRIPSKISILPSHSSMSFTQRNTRTTRYRRLWLCSRVFSIKLPSVGSLITSKPVNVEPTN